MSLPELTFPVLCLNQGTILIEAREQDIATCNKAGLQNGWYKDMLIIDSEGKAIKLKGARKLHGVGLFWGYNIFLNQRIKVELELSGHPFAVTLNEVKDMVRKSFQRRHGWSSRGDYEELQTQVRNAQSIPEIIQLIQ